jgi:hypothetical protein
MTISVRLTEKVEKMLREEAKEQEHLKYSK